MSHKDAQRRYDLKNKDRNAARRKIHYVAHRARIVAKQRVWQLNNQEKVRDAYYLRTYGISLGQYNSLRRRQRYACAVCHRHESTFKTRLAVDHNHKTQEIRGLLCTHCNRRVIGRHSDPELFASAARYLRKGTGFFVPVKPKRKRKAS